MAVLLAEPVNWLSGGVASHLHQLALAVGGTALHQWRGPIKTVQEFAPVSLLHQFPLVRVWHHPWCNGCSLLLHHTGGHTLHLPFQQGCGAPSEEQQSAAFGV
jgi:hypothetical protein